MPLDMVLNELSLTPAPDIFMARCRMSRLVQTIKAAKLTGVKGSLRTQAGLQLITLAEGYAFSRWAYDREVSQDERLFVVRLVTKEPYLQDYPSLEDKAARAECLFDGIAARGLLAAYLLDTLALSLASEPCWDVCRLQVKYQEITEGLELTSADEWVYHASSPDHIGRNATWIQERLLRDVRTGGELWTRRDELFPSLDFCGSTQSQAETLTPEMLPFVLKHLTALENYCRSWSDGGFDPNAVRLQVSPESEATLNQYGDERTIICPDNMTRQFSWHSKIGRHAWRIYFAPTNNPGHLVIGYIGPHLHISSGT